MRLNDRSNVLLPQPEGPISAVTSPDLTEKLTSAIAGVLL